MRGCVMSMVVLAASTLACASLPQIGRVIQPPRFAAADDRPSELRLVGPRSDLPLGGAAVRVWTRVRNPNPIGLTLSTLRATLILEETRAADGDFPLGLPLQAGQESTVPLDLSISFSDVPALAIILRRVSSSEPLHYRVEGTIGVEVGRLGAPTFGPMTLFSGELRAMPLDEIGHGPPHKTRRFNAVIRISRTRGGSFRSSHPVRM
jgi:Late embryogenesis abundant protein